MYSGPITNSHAQYANTRGVRHQLHFWESGSRGLSRSEVREDYWEAQAQA
jgi:hypothetical protein